MDYSEKRYQDWVVTGNQVIGDAVEENDGGSPISKFRNLKEWTIC